jgi:hypothetical protein
VRKFHLGWQSGIFGELVRDDEPDDAVVDDGTALRDPARRLHLSRPLDGHVPAPAVPLRQVGKHETPRVKS